MLRPTLVRARGTGRLDGARHSKYPASTMKITIAATLMAENQYSTAPKTLTLRALTAMSSAENAKIHSQPGAAGNQ